MGDSAKLTPMQRQYQELKKEYPDAILFFRLGDFYEMFGEDAVEASRLLGIALTTRERNNPDPLPMCGVPYHAAENYLAKLTKAGKKVAIAEQVSDPKLPGIVQREVVRVITPGTTFSEQILEAKENQYLGAISEMNGSFGLAVADLSTADFFVLELKNFAELQREIQRIRPKELVLPPHLFSREEMRAIFPVISNQTPLRDAHEHLTKHFGTKTLKGFGLEDSDLAISAASLLLSFLEDTQKGKVVHLRTVRMYSVSEYMPLDSETIKNLELFYNAEGKKEGSLLAMIDETRTPMGGRKLRQTLLEPLQNKEKIEERLDAVQELTEHPEVLEDLEGNLKEISDLERLIARIASGRGNPRDFLALKHSLQKLPELAKILEKMKSNQLKKLKDIL